MIARLRQRQKKKTESSEHSIRISTATRGRGFGSSTVRTKKFCGDKTECQNRPNRFFNALRSATTYRLNAHF